MADAATASIFEGSNTVRLEIEDSPVGQENPSQVAATESENHVSSRKLHVKKKNKPDMFRLGDGHYGEPSLCQHFLVLGLSLPRVVSSHNSNRQALVETHEFRRGSIC